jgi:hypothetical protein
MKTESKRKVTALRFLRMLNIFCSNCQRTKVKEGTEEPKVMEKKKYLDIKRRDGKERLQPIITMMVGHLYWKLSR